MWGCKFLLKIVEEVCKKCKGEFFIVVLGYVYGEIDSGGMDFGV